MKYSAAVAALALAIVSPFADGFASSKSAFTPRASFTHHPTSSSSSSSSSSYAHTTTTRTLKLNMLLQSSGGMLELEDWLEVDPNNNSGISKTVRKSPHLWKLASYAAIPAASAALLVAAPVVTLPAAMATGVVAGFLGRNKMTCVSSDAAKPAIAATLVEFGLADPDLTAEKVQDLREQFSVHPDDFRAQCAEVYRKYFLGMVKFDCKPQSSELTELENLKQVLQLDNLAIGEAHMLAASEWFRSACLFKTEEDLEDEESIERQTMNKILYLTERALKQNGETEGAFLYEMTRSAKVFNLTYYEALERVEEVVEPFYERALKSARNKLGTDQVSAAMLERARATLGVSPQMGFDLHESALNDEVRSLLGGSDGGGDAAVDPKTATFPPGTLERVRFSMRFAFCLVPFFHTIAYCHCSIEASLTHPFLVSHPKLNSSNNCVTFLAWLQKMWNTRSHPQPCHSSGRLPWTP